MLSESTPGQTFASVGAVLSEDESVERACFGDMHVIAGESDGKASGEYLVRDASGSYYEVDLEGGSCSCDEDGICAHRRRVALSVTFTELAAPGEPLLDRVLVEAHRSARESKSVRPDASRS